MIIYIIKSTLSLTVLYILYYFLLRNTKSLDFSRFYLLFTIIFSLTIPLLQIPTGISLPLNQNVQDYSSSISNIKIQGTIVNGQKDRIINLIDLLSFIYILISLILLARFVFNLGRIINMINKSGKVLNTSPRIVLSEQKILPYSFFQYIIVSKTEYEKGRIDNDLIIHEQAHCNQHHSIDILFVEIVKIIFWFNPIVWILKKEIQLNHEYLADNEVLQTQNLKTYQNVLLNLVFRNNSTYLASNFSYSLTKKRLIMMTKNNSSMKSMVRKITIVPLVLMLAVTLTFSQKNSPKETLMNFDKEWWFLILEKHKIEPLAFNNFENVFEMGSYNSIENRIVTLKDALFVVKTDKDEYTIIKSPLAYHDLDKNIIEGEKGTFETFTTNNDVNPLNSLEMRNFKYKIEVNKYSFEADRIVLNNERKLASKEQNKTFQEKLKGERNAAIKEQEESFQERLKGEREAAALEQNSEFQEKLAGERKAARDGKIVIGDK